MNRFMNSNWEANMAKFEVEGNTFDTKNFSEDQTSLVNSLSITDNLIKELTTKHMMFLNEKQSTEKVLEAELGSEIKKYSETSSDINIILSNGEKTSLSAFDTKTKNLFTKLLFLNDQISYYSNQLQVLDTAKITYSKIFYETLMGAE